MIRVEFIRQLRRPRTWGLGAALVVVPVLIAIANRVNRGGGDDVESNLYELGTNNGVNFAIFVLLVMSSFLVIVVASLAGESVSGEASWGTLRYLLIRPVRRTKLISAKLFVAAVLSFLSALVVVLVALLIGSVMFGWADVYTIAARSRSSPVFDVIGPWEGVWRLALATGYVTWCMLFVVAAGMFLSTLTDSTAAAVVGTIVITTTCAVLLNVPTLAGIKPIVPTRYWGEWNGLFNPDGASDMWKGIVSSLAYTTVFATLAQLRFRRKDILS